MERVEIQVKGRLDREWSDWFEGMVITHTEENDTLLVGPVTDQAALYGLLAKLGDLGLALLSVKLEEDSE